MEEHVEVWKQALSRSLSSQSTVPCGPGVRNLLLVLQMMYNVSIRHLVFFFLFSPVNFKPRYSAFSTKEKAFNFTTESLKVYT